MSTSEPHRSAGQDRRPSSGTPQVLNRLKPDELQVTNVYAERSELTWTEAARLAGAADPATMGEHVRRKLKRLGAEHNRRLVQTGRG